MEHLNYNTFPSHQSWWLNIVINNCIFMSFDVSTQLFHILKTRQTVYTKYVINSAVI